MRAGRLALAGVMLALVGACVSPGATQAAYTGPRDRNLLTEEEIVATKATDAFRVVRAARPAWLLPKIAGSRRLTPEVYVDGSRAGGVNSLSQYSAGIVHEIKYLTADEATTRFGTGHGGGAILVALKR
jgi:hypothetical protein